MTGFPFNNHSGDLSFLLFQTLCRSSGPLYGAPMVAEPGQSRVKRGCRQGRGRAGESGNSRSRESKRRAGFCPSEGNFFIFNIAVTWLEPSKVLFKIGREEEMGCDFKSWKKAVHVQDTHYDHCFRVNYRIPGEAMCSGTGASRVHGC